MAGVVTLVSETDTTTKSGVNLIQVEMLYVRAIGDDEAIVVTPTAGQLSDPTLDAVNQDKGYIEAPWGGIVSVSMTNEGAAGNDPAADPLLLMSLSKGPVDLVGGLTDGEVVDALPGEAQTWPVSFPVDLEQVRCYAAGTQAAGARTLWLLFSSQDGLAATWRIILRVKESA